MKDKLRELVERWKADADIAAGEGNMFNGGLIMTKQQCSAELLATLDTEDDGEANTYCERSDCPCHMDITDCRHKKTRGIPARSGVVSDEDVRDVERYRWLRDGGISNSNLLHVISDDYSPPFKEMKFGKDLDAAIDAAIQGERHER